jgi:GNAT superfamily N-acetyltransferase
LNFSNDFGDKTMSENYVSWSIECDDIYDEEGEVIGSEEYVLIDKIFVKKEDRRKGIARTMLLNEIEIIKKEHKGIDIKIAAYPFDDKECDMEGLVSFYESVGFEVENTESHAVIMKL